MNTARKLAAAAGLSVIAWISVALVAAQAIQVDTGPFFRVGGRHIVRLWQDFTLRQNETTRNVVVILGSTTIAGTVDEDVVTVLGSVRLEGTARINGAVVTVGGNATVAEGATVQREFVVVGGSSTAPTSFSPGGDYTVIGNAWMAEALTSTVPWLTRGLLWGRLIVPSLGWIWGVVGMVLILTLAINVILHRAVGLCADAMTARPASTFLTGLLVLLLTGPVAVLLAATVIGVAIVPFLIAAVIAAWIVGKVGVARWIGRSILGHGSDETPIAGIVAVTLGFAGLILVYMVPLVGLMAWALVGVFGLGSASVTVLNALRRERPPAAQKPTTEEPAEPPVPPVPPPAPAAAAYAAPVYSAPAFSAPAEPAASPAAAVLAALPHATFMDRLAAAALDVALVIFIFNAFLDHWFRHDPDPQLFLLFAYFVVFWAWKGATLGGLILHLRVIHADGRPLSGADAIVRGLASLFSIVPLGLGFFWILRDPRQQAWHDKIAGTHVVKVPKDWQS